MANAKPKKSDEKVLIMIPYVEGEGEDQTVGINGEFWKIKKGVYVEVPRKVAKVIQESQKQNMVAIREQERMKLQIQDLG